MTKAKKICLTVIAVIALACAVIMNMGKQIHFNIVPDEVDYISLSNRDVAKTVDDDVRDKIIDLLNSAPWTVRKNNSNRSGCSPELSVFVSYKKRTYNEYFREQGTGFWFDENQAEGDGMIYTVRKGVLKELAALAEEELSNVPSYENDTNPNGERLFNIDPDEVDHIELYNVGKTIAVDDENCSMIIDLLNDAVWTKKQDRSAAGGNNAYGIVVYYTNGENEFYYCHYDFICIGKLHYTIGHTTGVDDYYFKPVDELSVDLFYPGLRERVQLEKQP